MPLTLGECYSWAGSRAREYALLSPGRRHRGATCFEDWGSVSMRQWV